MGALNKIMKKYQLNREDYIKEKQLHIERLELGNIIAFEYFKTNIQFLIDSFNKEYQWDGMFDIGEVKNRINKGHILFILYYDNQPIGYVWFKELDKNICFGYNLYVTKEMERPKYSPKWFYNKVSGTMLEEYDTIKVEIEDWNKVVFDLVESIGYKKIL
jgi:hypothetical protein